MLPVTPLSAILFGAAIGFFLWLSTVAPTNAIIAVMFGTRWLTTLSGLAFFSHQVGGFLGVWLGGCCLSAPAPMMWSGGARSVRPDFRGDQPAHRGKTDCPRYHGAGVKTWRTPAVIVVCGCLITMRLWSALDAWFLPDATVDDQWLGARSIRAGSRDRDPAARRCTTFCRRDRRSIRHCSRDHCRGAASMQLASSSWRMRARPTRFISPAACCGFGLSGCSFNLVISSFGQLLPENWRSIAFGAGTASGSFGQFLFSPLAVALIDAVGWQATLEIFAGLLLLIIPLALAVATPRSDAAPVLGTLQLAVRTQTYRQALAEAFSHRSSILRGARLLHLRLSDRFHDRAPAGVFDRPWPLRNDRRLDARRDRTVQYRRRDAVRLARRRIPKRYILSFIYFARALAVVALITLPASPAVTLIFGAVVGLLWLSSVPPTSGLVAVMFGMRWFAMLFGVVFFSHQVGGFRAFISAVCCTNGPGPTT